MKSYLVYFMLAMFIVSGGEFKRGSSEVFANSEKNVPNAVWHADLTHDGKDEEIVTNLIALNSAEDTGEGANVSVYAVNNGVKTLIWSENADIPHAGWNGLYLYTADDGKRYLLRWIPYMSAGNGAYLYDIFSLDKTGKEQMLDNGEYKFTVDKIYKGDNLKNLVRFVNKVNSYLNQSVLIADTDGGKLEYGTQENPVVKTYMPVWLFEMGNQ